MIYLKWLANTDPFKFYLINNFMKKTFFIILLFTILYSCTPSSNSSLETNKAANDTTVVTPTVKQSSAEDSTLYLIKDNKLGPISVGKHINNFKNWLDFTLEKKTETRPTEDGEEEYPVYLLKRNSDVLLKLIPKYEDFNAVWSDTIDEIIILSPLFKTEKNIGIGSTVKEFVQAYPDAQLQYTYVSNRFFISSDEIGSTQFTVDSSGYKDKKDKLYNSDLIKLYTNQFDENAKILSVRIYE
jgi:hypothetical protein